LINPENRDKTREQHSGGQQEGDTLENESGSENLPHHKMAAV